MRKVRPRIHFLPFARRLTVAIGIAGSFATGMLTPAQAGAHAGHRGSFAHHSQVRVWHGDRVGAWTHPGNRSGHLTPASNRPRHASAPRWNSAWGWSRAHGYPHRWWSFNNRKHPHFAARRHMRHARHSFGPGSHHAGWRNAPRRPGVWYASPGFGSTAARGGPVRQGVWYAD